MCVNSLPTSQRLLRTNLHSAKFRIFYRLFIRFSYEILITNPAIDHLTDGILISDATGMVLYINNAFAQSTHILPEEILNHKIQDLQGQDRLYTGGVIQEIITTHKSAFRLCTTYKTDPPLRGYLAGTPIFNENGELHLIVVCHRSLITLRDLQSDFQTFLQELRQVAPNSSSNPDTNDNSIVSSENIMIGKKRISGQYLESDPTYCTDRCYRTDHRRIRCPEKK